MIAMRFTLPGLVALNLTVLILAVHAQSAAVKSRPELTNYEETSRYDDVRRFFDELQKQSPLMRVESFGHSHEGRDLPLIILADPPTAQPRDAKASSKPVVFVLANIHGGEVEGKEAAQHLARRILTGDLRPLLDQLIILLAPIYNADGNERISLENRTEQNGPIGGVGQRENAQDLDLNRDYIKLEAPETKALIRLFNRWDPHLTVDLHTTDGSYHGYPLTYSIPLNPAVDARLLAYHRDTMMPALNQAMLARHKFRTYYYGNFSGPAPKPGEPETRTWRSFTPQPRIGQNYLGFRNRLTILSEAYTHLAFRRRIEATEAFVEEIFKFAATHSQEIRQLTRRLDEETIRRGLSGPALQLGVEFEMRPLPKPVELLVGEVTRLKNPRSGKEMIAMVEDQTTPVKMLDYGMFTATRSVPAARVYLFRRDEKLAPVLEKLLAHGIAVEELTAPFENEVERFVIQSVNKAKGSFQNHHEVRLTGHSSKETVAFPAGTVLVRAAQPLGMLAACLLEPESDDGLVTWNFLDAYLETGKIYPIYKLMKDVNVPTRIMGREKSLE